MIGEDGTLTITDVLPAILDQPGCVGYAGRLTVMDGDRIVVTVDHPFGEENQWVEVGAGEAGGAGAETGGRVHGAKSPTTGIAIGLVLLGLGTAGVAAVRRRQNTVTTLA
jgi:hypothetical protein